MQRCVARGAGGRGAARSMVPQRRLQRCCWCSCRGVLPRGCCCCCSAGLLLGAGPTCERMWQWQQGVSSHLAAIRACMHANRRVARTIYRSSSGRGRLRLACSRQRLSSCTAGAGTSAAPAISPCFKCAVDHAHGARPKGSDGRQACARAAAAAASSQPGSAPRALYGLPRRTVR